MVEAIEYLGTGESFEEIDEFTDGQIYINENRPFISTLEGNMYISIGDYIIKGVKGEFYPCRSDIFAQTYEIVE